MLKNQNNPQVLAAIGEIVKSNREQSVKFEQKVAESRANKYGSFKPAPPKNTQNLQENK